MLVERDGDRTVAVAAVVVAAAVVEKTTWVEVAAVVEKIDFSSSI